MSPIKIERIEVKKRPDEFQIPGPYWIFLAGDQELKISRPNALVLAKSIDQEWGSVLNSSGTAMDQQRVPRECETLDGIVSLDLSVRAAKQLVDEVLGKSTGGAIIAR